MDGASGASGQGLQGHEKPILQHTGSLSPEIRRRVAIANQAFSSHRRVLFQNEQLSLPQRCQLFQSLVLSKLCYGVESWLFSDDRGVQYFKAAVMRLTSIAVCFDCDTLTRLLMMKSFLDYYFFQNPNFFFDDNDVAFLVTYLPVGQLLTGVSCAWMCRGFQFFRKTYCGSGNNFTIPHLC